MLNCKDLTRLVSESFERKLTIGERLNLWMHVSMCVTCRQFRRLQLRINEAIRHRGTSVSAASEETANPSERLSDESRSRLQQAIASAANEGDSSLSDSQSD